MTTEYEMRLLAEMAEEIEKHGRPALPGSLRSLIKGKRASRVAALLKSQANTILDLRWKAKEEAEKHARDVARLKDDNEGLRNGMDEMSRDLADKLKL